MKKASVVILVGLVTIFAGLAQNSANDGDFTLALPDHNGQLHWHADGFKIVESSAKSNGSEIGFRGKDASGQLTFLVFLFLLPEQAPLTSAKCRDGVLELGKKSNPSLKILDSSEIARPHDLPVSVTTYSEQARSGTTYVVRAFVSTGDICGDLEVYSDARISADEADLRKILASYRFDPNYVPQSKDAWLYAQILYKAGKYKTSAPMFEKALAMLNINTGRDVQTMTRVLTDQAGMSYGMAGDVPKARALFEAAIVRDPTYPLYYYNLACADAEEKKLADARVHLEQAFARKSNVIRGENMPDPTKDDSFLPYRGDKGFWTFIESLH